MITHSMKTRRQLRSALVSALSVEERLEELRAAEARCAGRDGRPGPADGAPAGAAERAERDSTADPQAH
jgi:hypothetical protein